MNIKDHPAVLAWQALSGDCSIPNTVSPVTRIFRKPKTNLRPVYRLTGLASTPWPVIAKRCGQAELTRELAVYLEILPHTSLAYPQMLGTAKLATDETWLFLQDVGGEPYDPSNMEHRRLAGTCLGQLHTTETSLVESSSLAQFDYFYDVGPNRVADFLDTSLALLAVVTANPALNNGDLDLLRAIESDCELLQRHWQEIERFSQTIQRTLVHGDLLMWNMRVCVHQDERTLVLIDWEKSGLAIPAFDVTRFLGSRLSPDIHAYVSAVKDRWPDVDTKQIRRLGYVGEIFRWLDAVRWELELLRHNWVQKPMSTLRVYRRWMDDIRLAAPWHDNPALADSEWRSVVPADS